MLYIHLLFFLWFPLGFGHICGEPGDQPSHRCLPQPSVRRQPGSGVSISYCHAGHLLHPGGCSWIATRENETGVMGSADLLGTGWPFCREFALLCFSLTTLWCFKDFGDSEYFAALLKWCFAVIFDWSQQYLKLCGRRTHRHDTGLFK